MVDVWLDAVTPKDSLLIYALLPLLKDKGYKTLVTAKKQAHTTEILELLGIKYTCIGEYSETLKEKLAAEQKRTLQFIDLFDKIKLPRVLWSHGDVSATRTAFGLQIPIVYANDTAHGTHAAKLVCPLVDWLVTPLPSGKAWSKFGTPKSKIALYDGVEEIAWLSRKVASKRPAWLKEADKVVLFRNAEYKASCCKNLKVDTWELVKEISKVATVVYLPRYAAEKNKLEALSNVVVPPKPTLAFQFVPYVDAVVGGGTICREAALMGIPTVSFHFWDAIPRYLKTKGFPIQYSNDTAKILRIVKAILRDPEKHKMNTANMLNKLESPAATMMQYIEKCMEP